MPSSSRMWQISARVSAPHKTQRSLGAATCRAAIHCVKDAMCRVAAPSPPSVALFLGSTTGAQIWHRKLPLEFGLLSFSVGTKRGSCLRVVRSRLFEQRPITPALMHRMKIFATTFPNPKLNVVTWWFFGGWLDMDCGGEENMKQRLRSAG